MREKIRLFKEQSITRNISVMVSGTAVSQLIGVAFAPLLTRLYGPETFGLLGVFLSITAILGTVAAASYPLAIVLPRDDASARELVRLSIFLGILTSLLTAITLYFFGLEILGMLNALDISGFMYLIPVSMFITVIAVTSSNWLIRQKAFNLIAKLTVASTIVTNTIKAGLGFILPTAIVLVVMNTLGELIKVAMMLFGLSKSQRKLLLKPPTKDSPLLLWRFAKKYSDFPLFRSPQVLINAVSQNFPIMMLAASFGSVSVGHYVIATTVLVLPARLVGNAFSQVFYGRVVEAVRLREDVKKLIVKSTAGLALIGIVPFLFIIIAGPTIFSIFFGPDWETAGIYARWLSGWLFFQFINAPAVTAIPVLRLQKGLLKYELFSTGSKALALYIGMVFYESEIVAIALFSGVGLLAYAWLIAWVTIKSGKCAFE